MKLAVYVCRKSNQTYKGKIINHKELAGILIFVNYPIVHMVYDMKY